MKNDAETEGRGDAVTDAGKPWWQSRTIIGAVAAILSAVLGLVLRSDVASSEDIAAILTAAGTVVGGVLAIYGRIKAEKPIEIRRAVRATPEEISCAQRSTPGGRGGLNKGDALVRLIVLLFVTLAVLSLVLAFTGCSTVQTQRGARYQWVVSVGTPIEKSGRTIVRTGSGVAIVSGASIVFLPVGIVVGIPCYLVGGVMWEGGAAMTGNFTDWTYGGL